MVASTAEGRSITKLGHSLQRVWHKICPLSWGSLPPPPPPPPRYFVATGLLCLSLLLALIVPTAAHAQKPNAFWNTSAQSFTEGTTYPVPFQVTQNIATATSLSVTVTGTATHGTDYTFGTGVTYANGTATVTIPAGTQAWTQLGFDITLVDDGASDSGETIILTIVANSAFGRGSPYVLMITVTEDSGGPTYVISGDPHVGEVLTLTRTIDDPDDGVQTEIISWEVPRDGQSDLQVQDGGTSYTPTVTQLGFPIRVKIVYTDGNGNNKIFYTNELGPIGSARPRVVSIKRQVPTSTPTDADSLTWRVTFNEAVQNVDAADFEVTGTSATLVVSQVGSTNSYDITASGGDLANLDGTVTLRFASGQNIQDVDNVALVARYTTPTGTNQPTYEVTQDTTPPRVASIERYLPVSSPATNISLLNWKVTFNEKVRNVDAADFEVDGTSATITNVQRVDNVYYIRVEGGDLANLNGATVTLRFVPGQDIQDNGGNALSNTTPTGVNQNTYVVNSVTPTPDTTAPQVTSIARQTPSTSPTDADTLVWRVTFNEAVQNVDGADFIVSGTTATLAVSTLVSNTIATYDVTAFGGDLENLNATVTLSFANGQNIQDTSGNALSNTTPTGANDNSFVVANPINPGSTDTTAPRVTSIARQTPTTSPTDADTLVWRVTFSEAVQNVDAADFTVTGTTAILAVSQGGSTNSYDITASGGNLAGLNATVTLSFASGQNIQDTSGNALSNTTPTGANNNFFMVDNSVPPPADTTAPRVTSITRQTPSTSSTAADSLTWRVTFDEAVQNVDVADFTVTGTTAILAVSQVGSTNAYDITASGGNLAGLNATVTLSFASGQNIQDTSGNALSNTTPTGVNDNSFVVANPTNPVPPPTDTTAPRVDSIARRTPSTSSTAADSLTWRVTFNEAVQNVDANDFDIDGTTATLGVAQVSGTNSYDITASGGDLAGLNATVTLRFAGNQDIEDTSGNALSNTTPTGTNNDSFTVDNPVTPPPDTTAPQVDSIVRQVSTPTDADILIWRVTFSEAVQNVDATDFRVAGTTATLDVSQVGSTNSYDITASGGDLAGLTGTVTLGFAQGQNIQDTSGNALSNTTPTTGTNENIFVVDNMPKLSLTLPKVKVREGGGSGTYQVQLLGQADGDVTVEITGDWRGSNVHLDPTMFVLSASNKKQTITVTAGEDEDKKNSEITLTHTAKIGGIEIDSKTIELTIVDNDIPPSEVIKSGLLRFGRTMGDQSVVAIQDRLNALRSPGFVGTIAGHSPLSGETCHEDQSCVQLDREAFPANLSEEPTQTLSEDEILASTSFSHTKETTAGASMTYWGQGVRSGFKGRDGQLSLDGDVWGFMMGVDWSDDNRVYGLMLSRNKAEISSSSEASSGHMDMKLTALVPYAGMNINDDLEIWGALGFGSGEVTRKEKDADDITTDLSWRMVAFGASGELPSSQSIPGADLRWRSDVLWTQTKADAVEDELDDVSGKTLRKRLGVESVWAYQLATGALFRPSLEVGLRHDSGDAETGFGLDIGGGFEWSDPGRGLSVVVKGRKLVLHEKAAFDDWGVRLTAVYDPTPATREGFSARISQQLGGVSPEEHGSLLKKDQLPGVNDPTQSDGWEVEVAYGVSQGEGMVGTSYMSVEGPTEAETTRLGYRIQPDLTQAQNMSLDVWAEPGAASAEGTGDKDDRAGLKLTTLW